MIQGATLERVKRAKASRSHMDRKGPDQDTYGANAREGGNVITYPQPVASYDGTFTTQRLRDLAKLCGKGGFVVSPRNGNAVDTGYAVSVHPECDQVIRGFVGWRDLLEYMTDRDRWQYLSHPNAVLRAWRDWANGCTVLSVCTVVRVNPNGGLDARQRAQETARQLAYVNESRDFVDMTDGRVFRV